MLILYRHQLSQIHPLKKIWITFWTIVQRMSNSKYKSPVNDMSDASLWYHKRKYKEAKAEFKKSFVSWLHRDKQKSLKALYPPNLTTKIVTNLIG